MAETNQQKQNADNSPMDAVREAATAIQQSKNVDDETRNNKLKVSVLSGFLGAGKTTVLQHLLHNSEGKRIAVIVNDMADINIDANLLLNSSVVEADEKMVALSNGCICCTLREDLFINLANLAVRGDLDYVIIESSGISEPLPVAETFSFKDVHGTSLGDVAKLDTLITVVDGSSFMEELHVMDTLKDRGWETSEEDSRTIADLFCDQIEFANVIVMNKTDLMDDDEKKKLLATLQRFNPNAHLIEATYGQIEPSLLLGTNLFRMEEAEQHPGWLVEARVGEHTPETVEYGISSITFRSRRPFNMQRFNELKTAMEKRHHLHGGATNDSEEKKEEDSDLAHQVLLSEDHHKAARSVIRSKGLVWLGNRQSHWQEGFASLAGQRFTVSYRSPWLAAISGSSEVRPPLKKEDEHIWQGPFGDRRTELVVIGQDMDHTSIMAALEACVLTDDEMAVYQKLFLGSKPLDLLDSWADGKDKDEVAARLRRFEIEVLAPKSKRNQILQSTPVSTTPVSAHRCIATFQGSSRFHIKKYLRYAHLMADLASGLVKEFTLPDIASTDTQTNLLAEQTSDDTAVSDMLAYLKVGEMVELEWLQIRVELDTEDDQDRFIIVEQVMKINNLDEQTESMLLTQYPKVEIMIPKHNDEDEEKKAAAQSPSKKDSKKGKKGGKKGKKKGKRG